MRDGFSVSALGKAFVEERASNWHPATWLSHMLDVSLFGMNAGAHHAANAFWHALAACLLFGALRQLSTNSGRCASPSGIDTGIDPTWLCAWVACLFAIHPTRIESVAWISERKDTLSAVFAFATLWLYAIRTQARSRWKEVALVTTFALGLMAKPMLVTLPFALLLLDYWPLRRIAQPSGGIPLRDAIVEKLPLFALATASSVVTFAVQQASGAVKTLDTIPLLDRAANATLSIARYLGIFVWPSDLALWIPPLPDRMLGASPELLGAAVLIVALSAIAWRARRSQPAWLVGWLWFLGTVVPVLGFVQVGNQSMAVRYTYLPFVGLFVALAWGSAGLAHTPRRRAALAVAGSVIALASTVQTWREVRPWRDSRSLWEHALAATGENFEARMHLGILDQRAGRFDSALDHFRAATVVEPESAAAHQNLATVLLATTQTDAARIHFERALAIESNLAPAQLGLANVLRRRGEIDAALRLFESALALEPRLAEVPGVREAIERALDRDLRRDNASFAQRVESHRRALRLRPGWNAVANNLAWILATDPSAEAEHHLEAVMLARSNLEDGRSPERLDTLAAAFAAAGRFDEAIAAASEAAVLASAAAKPALAAEIEARIEQYRAASPHGASH